MILLSSGGKAKNGTNRSHAFSQVATAWGYFLPHTESWNAANASPADLSDEAV